MSQQTVEPVNQELVLGKAIVNAARYMSVSQSEVAEILGVDRSYISKMQNTPKLKPGSKAREIGGIFVAIYRSLYALTDGDGAWMRHYLFHHNDITGGVPIEQMKSIRGLAQVFDTLNSLRGRA